jgi:hypothetical protein
LVQGIQHIFMMSGFLVCDVLSFQIASSRHRLSIVTPREPFGPAPPTVIAGAFVGKENLPGRLRNYSWSCPDLTSVIRTQTPFLFFDKVPVWRNVGARLCACVLPTSAPSSDHRDGCESKPRTASSVRYQAVKSRRNDGHRTVPVARFPSLENAGYGSRSSACLDCDVVLCSGVGIDLSLRVQIINLLAKNSMESLLTEF